MIVRNTPLYRVPEYTPCMMATKQPRPTREQKYPFWLSDVEIVRLEAKEKKKGKSEDVLTEAKSGAVKAKELKSTKAKESPSVINGNK